MFLLNVKNLLKIPFNIKIKGNFFLFEAGRPTLGIKPLTFGMVGMCSTPEPRMPCVRNGIVVFSLLLSVCLLQICSLLFKCFSFFFIPYVSKFVQFIVFGLLLSMHVSLILELKPWRELLNCERWKLYL